MTSATVSEFEVTRDISPRKRSPELESLVNPDSRGMQDMQDGTLSPSTAVKAGTLMADVFVILLGKLGFALVCPV